MGKSCMGATPEKGGIALEESTALEERKSLRLKSTLFEGLLDFRIFYHRAAAGDKRKRLSSSTFPLEGRQMERDPGKACQSIKTALKKDGTNRQEKRVLRRSTTPSKEDPSSRTFAPDRRKRTPRAFWKARALFSNQIIEGGGKASRERKIKSARKGREQDPPPAARLGGWKDRKKIRARWSFNLRSTA